MPTTDNDGEWGPPLGGEARLGVALAQYFPPKGLPDDLALPLQIGDRVRVEQQTREWYFGQGPMGRGLFPKSFVHLLGQDETESPVVVKIESALTEWEQFAINKFKGERLHYIITKKELLF